MISAFSKGISQLSDRPTQKVLWFCIGASVLVFVCLWFVIGFVLIEHVFITIGWLESIIDILGGLATLLLTWFLFPGVVSAVVGLFLEQIAVCVEARHYPGLPKVDGLSFSQSLAATLRYLAVLLLLNMFLLVFLFVPPVFPFVFYSVNGYLLSREYFEMVAHRRLPPAEARALRRKNRATLFVAGVAIAVLLTVPLVNLLAPVIATAAMVHLFEAWRNPATPDG